MKNYNTLFFLAILTLMASCGKDNQTNDTPKNADEASNTQIDNNKRWQVNIDGNLFSVDTTTITHHISLGVHVFEASGSGGKLLQMKLPSLDIGIYPISSSTDASVIYTVGNVAYNGANTPQGVINITASDSNGISGTFSAELASFESTQIISATEGSFRHLPIAP